MFFNDVKENSQYCSLLVPSACEPSCWPSKRYYASVCATPPLGRTTGAGQGRARYFEARRNSMRIGQFRLVTGRLERCMLRCRSHKHGVTMIQRINHGLPRVHKCHSCLNQRLIVRTQGRMR